MLLALMLFACGSEPAEQEAAAAADALRTAPVEATTWRPTAEVTGTLDPVASVQLGFDVPGRLAQILVERGQSVSTGTALASLDRAIASAQLAQAEAGVEAAEAQAEAAEKAWARLEQVGNAVSEQQRTEAQAGLKGARAQLNQAKAAARMARTQVGYYSLRSPISGVVTNGPDNVGALVGAGTPLFVVEDLSSLRLKGTAAESETWLVEGLDVVVYPGTPGATQGFPGRVAAVIPSLDPATRRIPVEVTIASPPPQLKAHGFARAVITGASDEAAWAIPRGALVARPDYSVFVVTDPAGAPRRVPVQIVSETSAGLVVRAELAAGDQVVVDPPHGYGE